MSIAPRNMKSPKVRKDLNLSFASGAPLVIKVLADLENRHNMFFYRHVGPKGPKETAHKKNGSRSASAEDRPPHYAPPNIPLLTVARGPVPRNATRNCSSGSPDPERRKSGWYKCQFPNGSRSGDLHLQTRRPIMSVVRDRPIPNRPRQRGGQAPALRFTGQTLAPTEKNKFDKSSQMWYYIYFHIPRATFSS